MRIAILALRNQGSSDALELRQLALEIGLDALDRVPSVTAAVTLPASPDSGR
jgi:hypothetical protein